MPISRRDVEARVGAVEQRWAPRVVTAGDGPASGMRQIDLRGLGGLDVTIEADQFLDLGFASWRGEAFAFDAASTSRLAEDWVHRWRGGLLTTCGLTAVGRAEQAEGGMHGRAHLVSAQLTRSEGRWEGDRYIVEVAGHMREGVVFGHNFTAQRTISGEIGVAEVRIRDVIRNEGFVDAPLKVLYHVNVGWPVVDAGATVHAGAGGAEGEGAYRREVAAPVAALPEEVDALVAVADESGWSHAEVRGAEATVSVSFRPEQLPYLTVWRSGAAGTYAVGLEPGTCWPSHAEGSEEGKAGTVLPSGESLVVDLVIAVR